MFRIFSLLICLVALSTPAAMAQTDVVIGADKPGGSYYLYAGGLATWINQHSKTLRATAETTRGSVENARLLNAGRIAFGLVNAAVAYQQRHGVDQFKGHSSDKVRGVAMLDISPTHVVTLSSDGISSLAGLAGKRVSIGSPGSGTANTANGLFAVMSLTGKVKVQTLGYDESASNLRDGNLDAFFVASALPVPAVLNLASSRPVTLLAVPDDVFQKMHQQTPAYQRVVIPGGTYPGIKTDVATIGTPSLLLVRADVPDAVVHEVVSQMFTKESMAYMHNVYHGWNPSPDAQAFAEIGVPLHPGAASFYREHGMIK
jgi:TRAP transporter TAXI family solute receptor